MGEKDEKALFPYKSAFVRENICKFLGYFFLDKVKNCRKDILTSLRNLKHEKCTPLGILL